MSKTTAAPTAKPLVATRDFKDAGTGRAFAKGKPVEAEAGELENYRAAGLVAEQHEVFPAA